MTNQKLTIEEVQTAILKKKHVFIPTHNEGLNITTFQVTDRFITIEAGNVRRFGINALDYFLRKIQIL